MQLIILVVFAALMYALLIVPQQKRMKAQRQLLESLHEGDHVLTTSGIYGNIVEFEGTVVWLEIARGVEIKVQRDSVQAVIGDDSPDADVDDAEADDAEADDEDTPDTEHGELEEFDEFDEVEDDA